MTTKIVKLRYASLIFMLLIPSFAFLADFDFRQPINVSVTTNKSTWQGFFNLTFDSDIDNFNYVRFTDTDDNLLSYSFEEIVAGSYATGWIKGDWNTSINPQAFVYYGNTSAQTPLSNGWQTFETGGYDNFDDASINGTTWTEPEAGCVESGGTLRCGDNVPDSVDSSATFGDGFAVRYRGWHESTDFNIVGFWDVGTGDPFAFIQYLGAGPSLTFRIDDGPTAETFRVDDSFLDNWAIYEVDRTVGNYSAFVNDIHQNSTTTDFAGAVPILIRGYQDPQNTSVDWIVVRKFDGDDPVLTFGAEQSSAISINLVANDTDIIIFETVLFNVSTTDFPNVTQYFWDFGDGNSSFFTSVNTTTHQYRLNGTFNASVIVSNTTLNITDSLLIDVFEPTIEIWAQDQSNNEFLANFTLNITNSTASSTFTVDGFFARWNMTAQPYGDVTLDVNFTGFNHTQSSFSTLSASNINRTEQMFPAVITLFAISHQQFFNITASIPADVTFSNSTTAVSFGPVEEEFFNFDCDACSADSITSDIGLFFRYKTADIGGSAGTATLFLCNQFSGSCQNIRDLSGLDEENYVVVQDDGAWDIRTTSDTSVSTGTVNFMPTRLRITATVGAGEHVQANITQMSSPYSNCFINTGCPTGNVTLQISKVGAGIYSRVDAYKDTYVTLQDIDDSSIQNVTAYFTTTDLSYAVKFVTFDTSNQGLVGAQVRVWRQDDTGELFEISSMFTDGTGSTPFVYFEKDSTIFVLATFGDVDSGGIKPIFVTENNLEVNLLLGATSIVVDDPAFAGVTVSANPVIDSVIENTFQQFNVTIADSLSQLINMTWTLFDSQGTFSFNDTSVSSSGAVFNENVTIPALNGTSNVINMSYTIWRTFEGSPVFTEGTILYSVFPSLNLGNVCDLSNSLSGFKGLLALILVGAAFIVHPLLGGLALIPLGFWCFVGFDVVAMGLLFSIAMYLGVRQ